MHSELERFSRFINERIGEDRDDLTPEETLRLFRQAGSDTIPVEETHGEVERPWRGVMFTDSARPKPTGLGTHVDPDELPRHELTPNFAWVRLREEDQDDMDDDAKG